MHVIPETSRAYWIRYLHVYMILHQELTLTAVYTIYLYSMMYNDMGGCVVQVVDNIICKSVIFNLIITN